MRTASAARAAQARALPPSSSPNSRPPCLVAVNDRRLRQVPGDLFVERLEQAQEPSLGVRQRAGRNGEPVLAQRAADRTQRTMQAIPLRQDVRPDGDSISGIRKQPRRGRADDLLFRSAGTGRAQPLPSNPPDVGDGPGFDELRVLPTVRDPGLAAVRACALVRNRLFLANGQLGALRAAMRWRSLAAPPASTGCRRPPLAAAPEQLPGKPAAAGLQTLVLRRLRSSTRGRHLMSLYLGVAATLLRFRGLQLPAEIRILPARRGQLPAEIRTLPARRGQRQTEIRTLPARRGQRQTEIRILPARRGQLPAEIRTLPARRGQAAARQLGPRK